MLSCLTVALTYTILFLLITNCCFRGGAIVMVTSEAAYKPTEVNN